jgi:hypothetical protein
MKKSMSNYIDALSTNIVRTQVNDNLERVFDMEHDETIITGKESNLSVKKPRKKAPSRGGARIGSGRPKGSTNKITPTEMLDDFANKAGMDFHEFINEQIVSAYQAGDKELVSKYLLGFAKYLVQDVQEVKQDVTSNGQTMNVGFNFPTIELVEWKNEAN